MKNAKGEPETQEEADKRFRETFARQEYTAMRTELYKVIDKYEAEITKWQSTGSQHSTLIRDYQISIGHLRRHLERMSP